VKNLIGPALKQLLVTRRRTTRKGYKLEETTKEQAKRLKAKSWPTILPRWWAPHQQDTKTREMGRAGRLPASGVLSTSSSPPTS